MIKSQDSAHRAIRVFKEAYKEEFGLVLTDVEIIALARELLRFFGVESTEKPPERGHNE